MVKNNIILGTPQSCHYFANGENTVEVAKQFRYLLAKMTFPVRVSQNF